jgi:transcriptional regulator of arginine metabolism
MLHKALSEYLTRADRVQQLVLLRTGPGQAQILGVAIDGAHLPEVVGTLAGDDTILVIARDARGAKALVKRFETIAAGH